MDECLEIVRDGDVVELWLNRPRVLNALSRQLIDALDAALAALHDDPPRVLLLAGRGPRAFCSGADISEFRPVASTVEARARHYRQDVCRRLDSLPFPSIAVLHGYCFGGGMALAIACDIRIAAADTLFALPEAALGTFPGMGVTWRLPRIVGQSDAKRLIFSGERIDAAEASRIGLVNRVVPGTAGDAITAARSLAAAIAANAPLGVSYAKQSILEGARMSPEDGLMLEKDLNMFMDTTEDYVEGARAFEERRRPVFRGR